MEKVKRTSYLAQFPMARRLRRLLSYPEVVFQLRPCSSSPKRRRLDDKELDSGDEEGRADRVEEDEDQQVEGEYRERNVIDAPIGRHGVPNPTDGEVSLGLPIYQACY